MAVVPIAMAGYAIQVIPKFCKQETLRTTEFVVLANVAEESSKYEARTGGLATTTCTN